jgi:adenosine deaminase
MKRRHFSIIDLHCHFEGSIHPEISYEILSRHGHTTAQTYQEFLDQITGFRPDKEAFFDAISLLDLCMLDRPSVQAITADFIRRAHEQNVKILEVSFAPRSFKLQKPQKAFLHAFMDAFLSTIDSSTRHIDMAVGVTMLLLPSHFTPSFRDAHGDICDLIVEYRKFLTGVDLCTLDFASKYPEFERQLPKVSQTVKDTGLHLSAHAGEFYDARPVEKAVELGVERIGHGIRIIHDQRILEQVKEHNIALEVCPISNYKTGAIANDSEHPLRQLLRAGVRVTINSDDQSVQASTWGDDYDFAMQTLKLSEDEIRTCLQNSFEASFLPPERKNIYRELFVDGSKLDK